MKLIIDIAQDCYDYWCEKKGEYAIADALTSGTPYNPSGDLISRDALKKALDDRMINFEEICRDSVFNIIDDVPAVSIDWGIDSGDRTVYVRPQGKWVTDVDHCYSDDEDTFECSVCKEPFTLICGTPGDNLYNYCPNCGASMIQDKENKND